jgi:hypothetical protein
VCALAQDHAPGSLLVEEAGGIVTDYRGRPLDFGLGRTLGTNFGVVAARKEVHAQVIDAVQAVLAEEAAQGEGGGEESAVRFSTFLSDFLGYLTNWNDFFFPLLLVKKKHSSRSGPFEVCQSTM